MGNFKVMYVIATMILLSGCAMNNEEVIVEQQNEILFYKQSEVEKETSYQNQLEEGRAAIKLNRQSDLFNIPSDYDSSQKSYSGCFPIVEISKQLNYNSAPCTALSDNGENPSVLTYYNGKNEKDASLSFFEIEEVKYDLNYINQQLLPTQSSILLTQLTDEKKETILYENEIRSGLELFLDHRKVVVLYPTLLDDELIPNTLKRPIEIIYYGVME